MTSGFDVPILMSPNGPSHGPQASVLAMSTPITVPLGLHWNSPERPGGCMDVTVAEKTHLAKRWQISSVDTWLSVTDTMIRGEHIRQRPAELALDVRDGELEKSGAAYLDLDDWVQSVHAHAEGVQWTDEQTDLVVRLAVKAFHVEQQLATDGLLPPGERVVTMFAYDLAAAAYLAFAGVRLGFADSATVGQMIDALGHNAAAGPMYRSWASFGAAYVTASSVLLGGYPSDRFYTEPAHTVRSLLTDPTSPWTNIDFPRTPPS